MQEIGKKKPLKLMWRMICYCPFLYFADCLVWILIFTSPLIPGLLAKKFFDILSENAVVDTNLWSILAMIAVVAISRAVLIYMGARIDIFFRFKQSSLIRRNLLEILMKRPGANPSKTSTGEILNSFRDDASQIEDAVDWIMDLLGNLIFAICAIAILMGIDAKITLLVFTPLALVIVIANKANGRVEKYRRDSRKATGAVNGIIGEIFSTVQAVKVSGAEEHIIKHFQSLNQKRHKLMLRDTLFTQMLESIYENTISLGTGLILLLVAQSMKNGSFSVGDFAVFVYYLGFVADFTQFFGKYIAHYQQTCISFQRIADLMEDTPIEEIVQHNPLYLKGQLPVIERIQLSEDDKFRELELKGLSYRYPATGGGISDISFNLKRGSFTVICGKIGSGKTTLIRAILGLLPVGSGEILWNGKRISDPSNHFVYPKSAYVAQVPRLMSETVRDNILLGIYEDDMDLNKAIYLAVMEKDIETLENGLETLVGSRGVKLSGGQIQRVAAARMFIRNSELMVLDDISSALDVNTESTLWNRIFELKEKTCLVVSNRKIALQYADHIIVMKDGSIEAQGTLAELLESCKEIQSIYV